MNDTEIKTPFWKPAPGDTISGIVGHIGVSYSKYGPFATLGLVNAAGETTAVIPCWHAGTREVAKVAQIGDMIEATYIGERPVGAVPDRKVRQYEVRLNGLEV